MTTEQVLEFYGSKSKVAEALGISRIAVYKWGEKPPMQRQYQIQVLTKNKLKAKA